MYINPNTTIKILHNVPLNDRQEHTIYFADSSAQSSYFSGLAKYTFEEQTYQRVKRGYIRIAKNAESLYDCNYLMFQNSAFGNKWFYAFIKSAEYINNGVSEIEFEIDVMQTWFFDYELQECFVEREHSATDVAGEHTLDENLELGDYIVQQHKKAGVSAELGIIVDSTVGPDYQDGTYGAYTMNNKEVPTGLSPMHFPYATNFMNWVSGRGISGNITDQSQIEDNRARAQKGIIDLRIGVALSNLTAEKRVVTIDFNLNSIGSYVPHNKKLLTSPYMTLYVTNLNGDSAEYPLEYFVNRQPSFYLLLDSYLNSPSMLYPINYKGMSENKEEFISLDTSLFLPTSTDMYTQWLAQAKASVPAIVTQGGNTAGMMTALTGDPIIGLATGGVSILNGIKDLMAQKKQAELQPPQAKSNATGNTMYWNDMIDFFIMIKTIRPEIAKSIDDYFSRFGYATNRNKVPNTDVRPHWCYTKTAGCTIKGSIPADDMRKICSIYDKGITFWKKGDEVGNYTLDNTV